MLSRLYANVARAADNSPPLLRFLNSRSKARPLISDSDNSPSTETVHAILIPSLPRDLDSSYYSESVPERPARDKEIAPPSLSPCPYYAYYVNRYRFPTPRLNIGDHVVLVIVVGFDTIMALAVIKGFAHHASHSHYLAYAHVDTCFYSSIHAVRDPIHCSSKSFYPRASSPRFADRLVPLFVPYDEHVVNVCDPTPHCVREWSTVSVANWTPPIRAVAHLSASSFYPEAFHPSLIAEVDLDFPSDGPPPPMKYPIPMYGRLNEGMYNEAETLPYANCLIAEVGFR